MRLAPLLLTLALASASAQTGTITDTVVAGGGGEGLPGATVLVEGTRLGAATNAGGRFTVRGVPPGTYTLRASSLHFHDATTVVTVVNGDTIVVPLRLAADLRPPYPAHRLPPDSSWLSTWETPAEMEAAMLALGAPSIRQPGPRSAGREVWVWANAWLFAPYRVTRVVEDSAGVRGEVVAYWPLDPFNPSLDARLTRLENREACGDDGVGHLPPPPPPPADRRYCTSEWEVNSFADCLRPRPAAVYACRLSKDDVDWAAVLAALDAAGVWTLPDESTLPEPSRTITTDGWGLVVFTREGAHTHAAHWGTPDAFEPRQPETERAVDVARAVAAVRGGTGGLGD